MKGKITRIETHKEGVELPEEFLRHLELVPGSEVEIHLDKKNRSIIITPLPGDTFLAHYKDTMESMS